MNDLCDLVTYSLGFIVWLKQQPLAFSPLALLFTSGLVDGEDVNAKWDGAQQSQVATVFWSATNNWANHASGDSVVPLHSFTREKNTGWHRLYKF